MKKKILAGLLIGGLVTSVVYAYSGDCPNQNRGYMMYKKDMQYGKMIHHSKNNRDKISYNNSYKNKRYVDHFAKMFKRLDLSKKQRFEISILRDEMKLDLKKLRGFEYKNRITSYLNSDGFDIESYKKDMNSMNVKRVDIMARYMVKMFKVLTKEQIIKLKESLKH